MARVGVYLEPTGGGLGGADGVVALLASALRDRHEVTIIHHRRDLTLGELGRYFRVDLDGVELSYRPPDDRHWVPAGARWWRLGHDLREWRADYSRGLDLFVATVSRVPPFCHTAGAMYVYFPMYDRRTDWPFGVGRGAGVVGRIKGAARRLLHDPHWAARMDGYPVKLAISQYTAKWTARRWKVDCGVVFPPALADTLNLPKRDQVVALGRFTPMKRQRDLVATFATRVGPRLPTWRMACLGGLGDGAEEREYFADVLAARTPAVAVEPNVPPARVAEALAESSVFWHGAGLEVDEELAPEGAEHFGIATVEAMAAGCVPVVPNRGGQPEIVEHGVSGYLCETLDEMVESTILLATDRVTRERMAAAARARAEQFSRSRFLEGFTAELGPLLGTVRATATPAPLIVGGGA